MKKHGKSRALPNVYAGILDRVQTHSMTEELPYLIKLSKTVDGVENSEKEVSNAYRIGKRESVYEQRYFS